MVKNIKVFLADPKKDIKSLSPFYALRGETFLEMQDTIYNIEIVLTQQLQEDPKSNCRNNSTDYNFKGCIEEAIVTKLRAVIGCIPPWFTNKREDVCYQDFSLSEDEKELEINKTLKPSLPK